jgi:hypothetical protein
VRSKHASRLVRTRPSPKVVVDPLLKYCKHATASAARITKE